MNDWEEIAKQEPYYGVSTSKEFLNTNLSEQKVELFFTTGTTYVDSIIPYLKKSGVDFKSSVDYGCGVGRVLIPLSKIFEKSVGVDISQTMLDVCQKNLMVNNIKNSNLLLSDDFFHLSDKYSFIHCLHVLQHNSSDKGEIIIKKLINRLNSGGVIAIHFPYHFDFGFLKGLKFILFKSRLVRYIVSLIKKRPPMMMNRYSIDKVFTLLYEQGCSIELVINQKESDVFSLIVYAKR